MGFFRHPVSRPNSRLIPHLRRPVAVSAHRGGGESEAEGTLAAYELAVALGVDMLEIDVRRTADGVLVCHHDPEVKDLGPIKALTAAQLDGIAPTVAQVVALAARAGIGLHVDVKETGHEAALVAAVLGEPPTARPAADDPVAGLDPAADPSRVPGGTVFTTGSPASVLAMRRADHRARVLLTVSIGWAVGDRWRDLPPALWNAMVPAPRVRKLDAHGVAVHHPMASAPLRWWCKRNGLTVLVWTVDGNVMLRFWLHSRGVDIVTTDRPAFALAVRGRVQDTRAKRLRAFAGR